MPFPRDDQSWIQVRVFLEQYAKPLDAILAPNEFLEFFPGTYHYNVADFLPVARFAFVVFHKGRVGEIDRSFALDVLEQMQPVFANGVFVVYAGIVPRRLPPPPEADIQPLLEQLASEIQKSPPQSPWAIVVTTYNRPESLARSLPQLAALGVAIVVVDDGSEPGHAQQNQRIADDHEVALLRVPGNRGLPNAINVGISYWLADPSIEWISYFQDDLDIQPDILQVLADVQDANDRPLLSGRDAVEHPAFAVEMIGGHKVLLKRSTPGQHLHAHRDYWQGVLPIPTPYLGAPKPTGGKPGQGADEDWWIASWSPQSIVKRGGYVVCIPGLVQTFRSTATESTWSNKSVLEADGTEAQTATPLIVQDRSVAHRESEQQTEQAIVLPPDIHLDRVRVLVDGYNLQLTAGTGIKTYGTSLVKALHLLGAKVDVLLSRNASKRNKILDEVIFFDNQGASSKDLVTIAKGLIKNSASALFPARRRETLGNYVVKQGQYSEEFLEYAKSFNLPQCYGSANVLYRYLHLNSDIQVAEKVDIWHATYPLPIRVKGAKKITTIHDLIPLRLPYATLDNKEDFYNKVADALRDSAVTIAVSEHSKQDILEYFEVDPDKIVVTYQPIALEPLEAEDWEVGDFLKRYRLEVGNYLLFVGAIEPKKNVGRLLDAYATLDTDMPLVIVGKKGWLWEEELGRSQSFFDKDSKKQVKMLEYVTTKSLRYLYRGAFCLVFPSLYEGFGLPPIEAMNFGCPVITSNVSCLPEICGDAALYVDPYDVGDIQQKLEMMLGDVELRDRLAAAGQQNARSFGMENYVKRLHEAYTKALA